MRRGNQRVPIEDRFWEKVQKTESCWFWIGALYTNGYGHIGSGGAGQKNLLAHRVSWVFAYGQIPDRLCVLHRCDVRRCVRPDHLFLGTKLDNTRDMDAKGRRVITPHLADTNGHASLTNDQVLDIRRRYTAGGVTQWMLAREFGVWQGTISAIVRRAFWKSL